jgi:nitrogen-specific signal transduction histidine kinase
MATVQEMSVNDRFISCANPEELERQVTAFLRNKQIEIVANAIPDFLIVINTQWQIVFANKLLIQYLAVSSLDDLIGVRIGDVLFCNNSIKSSLGCGTAEVCNLCGAYKAFVAAEKGLSNEQECSITSGSDHKSIDLRIHSTPMTIEGEQFTIFVLTDISKEKQQKVLEQIFVHDLANSIGNLLGYAELMKDAKPNELEQFRHVFFEITQSISDEISAQQQLTAAENHEIEVQPAVIHSRSLLSSIAEMYKYHVVGKGKSVVIDRTAEDFVCVSDEVLLRRVISNLVKNALEASGSHDVVTLGCVRKNQGLEFSVHNNAVISNDVQLQIFQRSFSTKGIGRGLGTHSVKLLTEEYLNGVVSFNSNQRIGTVFSIIVPENIKHVIQEKKGMILTFSSNGLS